MVRNFAIGLTLAAATGVAVGAAKLGEYKNGVEWPEPPVVTPGPTPGAPPADAVVLLGTEVGMKAWANGDQWDFRDGVATAKKTAVQTKQAFGDCQLHLEFACPAEVKGSGQGRGNNGVLFAGVYEVQILDSFQNPTYFDGQCASLYKQFPPMVNASRKPGEFQTYDIVYEGPRFADGQVTRPAVFTVFHNGVVVQHHATLAGGTFYDKPPSYSPHPEKTPIALYYHGDPVKFRNIWVRELHPLVPKKAGS